MKRVEKAVARMMPDISGKRVLEPACGCTEFSLAAAKFAQEVICFDLDASRLDPRVTQTSNLHFEIMDATAISYADASSDTVVLYNAIGHLVEIVEPMLRECHRIIKENGAIWIVSSFRMDQPVIWETVLPLLNQTGLSYRVQEENCFTYVRVEK